MQIHILTFEFHYDFRLLMERLLPLVFGSTLEAAMRLVPTTVPLTS